jgi:hypothetical protein
MVPVVGVQCQQVSPKHLFNQLAQRYLSTPPVLPSDGCRSAPMTRNQIKCLNAVAKPAMANEATNKCMPVDSWPSILPPPQTASTTPLVTPSCSILGHKRRDGSISSPQVATFERHPCCGLQLDFRASGVFPHVLGWIGYSSSPPRCRYHRRHRSAERSNRLIHSSGWQ